MAIAHFYSLCTIASVLQLQMALTNDFSGGGGFILLY